MGDMTSEPEYEKRMLRLLLAEHRAAVAFRQLEYSGKCGATGPTSKERAAWWDAITVVCNSFPNWAKET